MKTIFTMAMVSLLAMPAFAQSDDESTGYSSAHLTKVEPVAGGVKGESECLRFDATFSKPLSEKPSAIVDVEKMHGIDGIVSAILDVIPMAGNKYRLLMKADSASCKSMLASGERVVVTLGHAKDSDGQQVLPDQRTFRASRDFK